MNNSNEQFVASPTFYDLENIIETKVGLTDSYQALVADLQAQNQQLTEKLIAALKENAKLKEQLSQRGTQLYSDDAYKEFERANPSKGIHLPNLKSDIATDPYTSQILMTFKTQSEMLQGYNSSI